MHCDNGDNSDFLEEDDDKTPFIEKVIWLGMAILEILKWLAALPKLLFQIMARNLTGKGKYKI